MTISIDGGLFMLEYPEVLTISEQLRNGIAGSVASRVLHPSKEHKFCWFNGDPAGYDAALRGVRAATAEGFGIFVEIAFDNGYRLCFNDGVNVRLMPSVKVPRDYQLLIEFEDGKALVFTVAMYGGIILHNGSYDNEYYLKSRRAVSPFSDRFKERFYRLLDESKPSLSVKAFLAAEQRFPGIGNGVLQDILLESGINPKRKISTLRDLEKDNLLRCVIEVLRNMAAHGGRDTEKDIYGRQGGYKVCLSRNTLASGCPKCGGKITKETYLGGSIYYCPICQPIIKQ